MASSQQQQQHRRRSSSIISSSSASQTDSRIEIATFSRLASFSTDEDDEDNASLIISLPDESSHDYDDLEGGGDNDDKMMRRGLVEYSDLRGCGTGPDDDAAADSSDNSCEDEDEGGSSLFSSPTSIRQYARLLIDENDDDYYDNEHTMANPLCSTARAYPALSIAATIFIGICTLYLITPSHFRHNMITLYNNNGFYSNRQQNHKQLPPLMFNKAKAPRTFPPFPAKALLGIAVNNTYNGEQNVEPPYHSSDFHYENAGKTRILTYWEEVVAAIEESQESNNKNEAHDSGAIPSYNEVGEEVGNDTVSAPNSISPWKNISSWGPCFPRALPITSESVIINNNNNNRNLRRMKKKTKKTKKTIPSRNWTYIVQKGLNENANISYPSYRYSYSEEDYFGGSCRPGFLIIGQGKCGTSSLYHYLTGHDRVLPAVVKQIHYFVYNVKKSLKWYYSNFPAIESFLGTGTLMTGEASPGYMPYPSVIKLLVKRMSPTQPKRGKYAGLEAYQNSVHSLPKIIAIVRDPIERAVSSYKYNYVVPSLEVLKKGRGVTASGESIPGRQSEQFYKDNYLYTFEELASAELKTLKECLQPGGRAEKFTYKWYGKKPGAFFYETFKSRVNRSLSPLIHLDGYGACYDKVEPRYVAREQWVELSKRYPNKVLDIPNLHLTQSIIGRGIYVLPLEWWYEVFASASQTKEDWIHSVCTEEMGDAPAKAMADVTRFLGLPDFDFTNVTSTGRYNVGGHQGYDTVTTDEEIAEEVAEEITEEQVKSNSTQIDLAAISTELMTELLEFYRPYNERLFELIGKRCAWKD